jgi:GR25 family glycosyltransferase involved in LPS biosynthesis
VACFESHRKAWARIVEEDWRQAIVMEDDAEVDLSEHMPKVAQFVADAPPDWQLLYLGINNARVRAHAACSTLFV